MPTYCPKCENEMLPYLKTGELKRIEGPTMKCRDDTLVTYQLYFCMNCRISYYVETDRFPFIDFENAIKQKKEDENARRIKNENSRKQKKRKSK